MDTIVTPVTVITLDSTRIEHSIKADLVARYFPPVVRLVQYDQSLPVIAVSLMQNGQTYTLPSGAAANIRVHKPDSTYVYNPALGCDSTRKIVYFEVTQAMAAANGDGLAIVEIVVDGDIAGTSLITLHFEENPVPEDAIESSDEWETIYELGERIIASTVTPVSTAAGMTDHNVVYLYTGTESGWNQGHMYYYNGTTWVDAGIAVTDTTLSVAGLAADAKKTGDEIADLKDGLTAIESDVTDLKEDFIKTTTKDKSQLALTTWSASRVKAEDGTLTYSPSQKTTDKVLYVGKGSIIKVAVNSTSTSLSISYYQLVDSVLTYIRSDVNAIRNLKYVCSAYDYCRISLIGTSTNPPVVTDYTIDILYPVENEFYGKKIAFLGDSITTFQNTSETSSSYNSPYYPTADVQYLEQTYEKMFFDACGGGNIAVSAISNSSWRNQGIDSCPSAYDDTRIARLATNGNPDYVFINMGTNDPYSSNIGDAIGYTYDVDTLAANVVYSSYAIQTTIRKIQVAYPNAKIIILIPKFASAIGSGNYTFEKWEKLINYIYQIGNMYGVYKIIDLRKCGISVETFSTDCIASGMHPNFTGMMKIGAYLIDQLLLT